jgi:hypothetical protein
MPFPWGLLVLALGVLYGYFTPGRQDKARLFRVGILWGLGIAIVLAVVGALAHASPLGIEMGFVGALLSALILTLLFVLGVWIGDLIEARRPAGGLRRV